jgi:hypothetical protein
MVPIPVHIWELIRQFEGVDLSLCDESDESIRARVEREVDERIHAFQAADPDRPRALSSLVGAAIYGDADTPRDEQIAQGVAHFHEQRAWQCQVRAAIEQLREAQRH